MATVTEGERLSKLEGAYEHLATRADVERLRGDVMNEIRTLETRVGDQTTRLLVTLGGLMIALASLAVAAVKYLP